MNNNSGNTTAPFEHGGTPIPMRILFGIIAFLSTFCNGLLCVVIMRNRTMLRSSYNVLVLALAVTDTVTGIMMFVTPDFIISRQIFKVPNGIAGELFCRLVDNDFFVWTFSKFSVAIVTLMAVERWFALARPVRYQILFTKRRVYGYLPIMWILVCVTSSLLFFEKNLDRVGSTPRCVWRTLVTDRMTNQLVTVLYCSLTYFIPLAITLATFFHIQAKLKNMPVNSIQRTRKKAEVKLSRMGALVALFLAICFVPNQLSYILYKFGATDLSSPQHMATIVLSMLNSCINPLLYCTASKTYRKEFTKILCLCKNNEVASSASRMHAENTINVNYTSYEMTNK